MKKKSAVFLIDINDLIDTFNQEAMSKLNQYEDDQHVPDVVQGQVQGLTQAGSLVIDYLKSSLKFAKFPKK